MLTEMNQKLFELKDKIRIFNKNKIQLDGLLKQQESEERKLSFLKADLEKEYRDVTNLEGLSFSGMFHSIVGDKEDLYKKEKQEYLIVKLKFDQCINSINILKKEIAAIQEDLVKTGDLEKEHDTLVAEKEKLIIQSNDPAALKINEFYEKISGLKLNLKEIDESVAAGEDLKQVLYSIIDTLQDALGWGAWDIMGGGIIATSIKHDKIDRARSDIAVAQIRLTRFSKELNDTGLGEAMSIDLSGFETFADYFFDNFIVDLAVQNKINNSLQQTKNVLDKVLSIMDKLLEKQDYLKAEIGATDKLRMDAVENS